MTDAQAREILTAIVHHRSDIRDHYSAESYRNLLARTFALVGLPPGDFGESKSRIVLARAHKAAIHRGIHGSPIDPATAASAVLRAAARTGR